MMWGWGYGGGPYLTKLQPTRVPVPVMHFVYDVRRLTPTGGWMGM